MTEPLKPFGEPLSEARCWIDTLTTSDLLHTIGNYATLVAELERNLTFLPSVAPYLEHVRKVHAALLEYWKALPVSNKIQFTLQRISALEGTSYRVTHTDTDSKVAMCSDYLHATLVCDALNEHVSNYALLLIANGRNA